jgi:hypothetical protein
MGGLGGEEDAVIDSAGAPAFLLSSARLRGKRYLHDIDVA